MRAGAEILDAEAVLDTFPVETDDRQALRCLAMHDGDGLAPVLEQLARESRYEVDYVTTRTLGQAREALERQEFDLVLLDQHAPDGDGLSLARELAGDARTCRLPVIMLTAEDAEARAREILRAGAVGYLVQDELTLEAFDQALENALRRGNMETADQLAVISNLESENAMLRRVALRNMRLMKAEVMPLLAFAWQGMAERKPAGQDTRRLARRLSRITRTVMGLIDDTVIVTATHRALDMPGPVDLGAVARQIIEDDCGEIRLSSAHIRIGDLPVLTAREPMIAMLFEELLVSMVRNARLGHVPEIEIGSASDPEGNPILWLTDSGVQLSARKQLLAQRFAGLNDTGSATQDGMSWSLCQRLAEKNGGQFKLAETEDGLTRVSIRFPKSARVAEEGA